MSSPFKKISTSCVKLSGYCANPLYSPYSQNVIITTTVEEKNLISGIYEYNIDKNEIIKIAAYDTNFRPYVHLQFIDKHANLHIFGECNYCFIFNLKSSKRIYDIDCSHFNCGGLGSIAYKAPNEFHIMDSYNHYVYNENRENSIQLNNSELQNNDVCLPNLVSSNNKLMIMGALFDQRMWYYNDKKWYLSSQLMPTDACNFKLVSRIDGLVHLLCYDPSVTEIWVFDTLFNKWYKSEHCVPICFAAVESCVVVLKWSDDCLHIIDFQDGTHYKVNIYALIPSELQKEHRSKFEPLIFGFVREFEKKNIISIPYVLKKLIWKYYPLFV